PGPEHALAEVEVSCDLGQALALLGDELDRLGLELGCEGSSCLGHRWTPVFELTLLTRRPPSVRKSIGNHMDRMDYPRYVAAGWQIGSGHIEAACKTVIDERLKRSGMRWGEDGADAVCHLRALFKGD